jgi:putative addiction module component (TIGR02574 family)
MSEDVAELLRRALNLPTAERADLVDSLIESLDEAQDLYIQAAWDAEIVRRMDDLNSGRIKPISLAEARRRLFSTFD